MSDDLLIPFVPDNIALPNSRKRGMRVVTSDLYNIAQRIKMIDPKLRLVFQEHQEEPWVVMQDDPDTGNVHFVSRYKELDARVYDDLLRMKNVPLERRMAETLKRIDKENAEREAFKWDEKMDRMAFDFKKALKDSGLEPLANVATPVRHYNKKV